MKNSVKDFKPGDRVVFCAFGYDPHDPKNRGEVTSTNDKNVFVKFPNFHHGGVSCSPGDLAHEGDYPFQEWMQKVDRAVEMMSGLSASDLSDYNYRDAFDDGTPAEEAARDAMEFSGYEGGLDG